jgi:hypothetical protein
MQAENQIQQHQQSLGYTKLDGAVRMTGRRQGSAVLGCGGDSKNTSRRICWGLIIGGLCGWRDESREKRLRRGDGK